MRSRVGKVRYPVFDGAGAFLEGGRWNSPGRPVIYCSSCLAGSLLEVMVHAGALQRLPGPHQCGRAIIPDEVEIATLVEADLPGWDAVGSAVAREYGDRWLAEERTAVLAVPALTARPFGQQLLINPMHPDTARVTLEDPVPVVWDARLFRI